MNNFKDTPDPDNIYLNIRIESNPDGSNFFSPATYDVTKATPILNKGSDYYVSVVDFVIPTSGLPLFIADCTVDPNDANNKNYMRASFAIDYLGSFIEKHVTFIPENNFPLYFDTPYYYVFSYEALLTMFNNCIADLFVQQGSIGGTAPYFKFNAATGLISLIVSEVFATSGATIWANNFSFPYLQSFRWFYDRNKDALNLPCNMIEYSLDQNNYCNEYGGQRGDLSQNFIYVEQEYYTLQDWLQIRKILITTTSIPVTQTYVTPYSAKGKSGATPQYPILFDFIPRLGRDTITGVITYYETSGAYRLVDVATDLPLNRINIEVNWEDSDGNVRPLYLKTYQTISIKLAFFKKSLYKNNWTK